MKERYEMKLGTAGRLGYIVLLLTAASIGLFIFRTIAESKTEVETIPPVPQQIATDVISYDLNLVKITFNWPKDFTVENISDKEISGFEIMIFAANDDGGPGEIIGWGKDPIFGVQNPLLKPREVISLPIQPQTVKKFQANGKAFLFVDLWRLWVNNDPKFLYSEGSLLQQDANNPQRYTVIRDAKGRSKHDHSHATPHITYSTKPPFPLTMLQ
jgi:hypothetical protein